jgi:hypothetical protein
MVRFAVLRVPVLLAGAGVLLRFVPEGRKGPLRTGKHKDVTAPREGVVKSIVAPNVCEECIEVKKPWLISLQHWR